MQSDTNTWQPLPDQLLNRVVERAKTLLAAEKVSLTRQADEARQATMATVIATQSLTIDDLTAACAALHEQAEADATALGAAEKRRAEDGTAYDQQVTTLRELEARLAARDAELAGAVARLAERNALVAALEHHLREVHGSTSWRLTRPLRWLRRNRPS